MRRTDKLIVLGATLVASAVAAVGRGNWIHQVMSMGALLWLGVPALIALGVGILLRTRLVLIIAGVTLWAIGIQFAVGLGLLHWDIYSAKKYCETLVPILDTIYSESGQYPASLDADERLRVRRPLFLRHRLIHYSSDGTSFSFDVQNPAEIFAGFDYSNTDRQWIEWRD